MWNPKKILFVSPHTDDAELGAGGTIHKWHKEGAEVHSVIFSVVFENKIVREREVRSAGHKLGLRPENIILLEYTNRMFHKFRQEILQNLVDLNNTICPDVVFVPSSTDCHQDHQVIHQEAMRAFKKATLLGYELPWNTTDSSLRMTVGLDDKDIEAKLSASKSYSTQSHKPYMDRKFIKAMA
ncbi:unnamed protein product, partial [marine sediment metagenome]